MKKIVLALLVLLPVSMVAAQQLPDVAVTPDHELYDVKTSVEEQIESLAPNETARASAKLENAEKRLSETNRMIEENRTDLANQTAADYSKEMQELQGFGERASSLAEQREIEQLVAEATVYHTEVLSDLHDKVPEEARAGIERALNSSVRGHQMAIQALNETGGIPDGVGGQDIESLAPGNVTVPSAGDGSADAVQDGTGEDPADLP